MSASVLSPLEIVLHETSPLSPGLCEPSSEWSHGTFKENCAEERAPFFLGKFIRHTKSTLPSHDPPAHPQIEIHM